jgi:hypothetical protein
MCDVLQVSRSGFSYRLQVEVGVDLGVVQQQVVQKIRAATVTERSFGEIFRFVRSITLAHDPDFPTLSARSLSRL